MNARVNLGGYLEARQERTDALQGPVPPWHIERAADAYILKARSDGLRKGRLRVDERNQCVSRFERVRNAAVDPDAGALMGVGVSDHLTRVSGAAQLSCSA